MDPKAALENARNARSRYANAQTEDEAISAATDLAAAFADLDQWLTRGGFLPEAWNLAR
jgi:hypothetical protein